MGYAGENGGGVPRTTSPSMVKIPSSVVEKVRWLMLLIAYFHFAISALVSLQSVPSYKAGWKSSKD